MITIHLKKKSDGSSISITRPDGSVTWHAYTKPFYALHDLLHYAVERTLRFDLGFFGLVAKGWDITDFGSREFAGDDKLAGVWIEMLVSLISQHIAGPAPDAVKFNSALATMCEQYSPPLPFRPLTALEMETIWSEYGRLLYTWNELPAGSEISLQF